MLDSYERFREESAVGPDFDWQDAEPEFDGDEDDEQEVQGSWG